MSSTTKDPTTLTLGAFREMTANLPESTPIGYHAYDKGCCISFYETDAVWMFPVGKPTEAIIINPGADYDGRRVNQ